MIMQSIRVFLAVQVPDSVRRAIDGAADPLRARLPRVRWVRPELWHFTLIFLGERPPDEVRQVEQVAAAACSGVSPFALDVQGTGVFPNPLRPRVLWIGADTGADELGALREKLRHALRESGIAVPDESFNAHLTVGRVRDDTTPEARRTIGSLWGDLRLPELPAIRVSEACLVRSDLGPGGSRYTTLATLRLAGDG
jgi:2'-5' RNA ligase